MCRAEAHNEEAMHAKTLVSELGRVAYTISEELSVSDNNDSLHPNKLSISCGQALKHNTKLTMPFSKSCKLR